MIPKIVHIIFTLYSVLLIIRILSSWFPHFQQHRIMRWINTYTDPYLNFFRKFIPPMGGRIDLSPILGFMALRFIEMIILNVIR